MHHIDEPVQHGEHLTVITEDMFPSPDPFEGTELESALQQSVPSFPTIHLNESVHFD